MLVLGDFGDWEADFGEFSASLGDLGRLVNFFDCSEPTDFLELGLPDSLLERLECPELDLDLCE